MAVSDFISGRGWDIDTVTVPSRLQIGDRLFIASFGNDKVLLIFERGGVRFIEGRARYIPNIAGGSLVGLMMGMTIRVQFAGSNKLDIQYSTEGGGPSPNGGGTSSGPGGN